MKKFRTKMRKTLKGGVCLALAVCMMIAFIPATGATEAETTTAPTYEYVFNSGTLRKSGTYGMAAAFTDKAEFKDDTLGYGWKPIDALLCTGAAFLTDYYRASVDATLQTRYPVGKNGTLFEITVGESGYYDACISYFTYKDGANVNIYLTDDVYTSTATAAMKNPDELKNYIANAVSTGTFVGTFNTYEVNAKATQKEDEPFEDVKIYLEKGKAYYLVMTIDGETTQKNYTTQPNYYYYHLDRFTLTKVGNLEEQPETVTENISFVATSNVEKGDMMTVEGFNYNEFTDSIPAGTYVTVTPKEYPGYEFKHWVRGSADNGVYVSDNPAYSFTALTHTFLTAIYENVSNEDDDTATVEFYNGNGQYLDKVVSTVGGTVSVPDKAKAPAMTGFEFANQWRTEDGVFDASAPLAKKLTRAVAQFNTPSTTFTITCGEEEVLLTYGSKHTFTSNNPVYWTREGAVVGYGTSYTHAAWDATEITTSETGELAPVVLLDDTKKDGAYMIEYNAAGKEILEVGIVFGSDGVNIGSCSSKATSQYKNQHGQFTAKPYGTETHARGYMIYKEDNTYKVVYSK